jgi:hypothetical protein
MLPAEPGDLVPTNAVSTEQRGSEVEERRPVDECVVEIEERSAGHRPITSRTQGHSLTIEGTGLASEENRSSFPSP